MRKLSTLLFVIACLSGKAQILNAGFENWTFGLDSFGLGTYITEDTFSYLKLDHWTSSNSLTGNPQAGGTYLVNRSNTSFSGAYSVQMVTDSIYLSGGVNHGLIAPGFIVNGNFQLDLTSILFQSGGLVNPQNLVGAGNAISQRYDKIGLWVKYSPIPGDSLLVWAVLKSRGTEVAECKLYYKDSNSTFTYIEGAFNYYNCLAPDTFVVMIASSNPNFSTLLSGSSGLTPGSMLLADSVVLVPFSGGSRPIVSNYTTYTFQNISKRVLLSASDTDCGGMTLTYTITGSPAHGTAAINGDTLTYNPAPGFQGVDTIYYSAGNGHYSGTGAVVIYVYHSNGTTELAYKQIRVYPNPFNEMLNMSNEGGAPCSYRLFDFSGRNLLSGDLMLGGPGIATGSLAPGMYLLELKSAGGTFTYQIIKQAN